MMNLIHLFLAPLLAPLATAGTIDLHRWAHSDLSLRRTCSPYITNVLGCLGWGEALCVKHGDLPDWNCDRCNGEKSTTARAEQATISVNFDTGLVKFSNTAGDEAEGTMLRRCSIEDPEDCWLEEGMGCSIS